MSGKYAIEIFFSEEDEGYIALVPELPGCSALCYTQAAALREAGVAVDLWLETARREHREIPLPSQKELLKSFLDSRR